MPAKRGPYDRLLTELDALLRAALHTRATKHARVVLPYQLRHEE
ncbi:hypothetical protein [Corallococcus sp. RDP092CA]